MEMTGITSTIKQAVGVMADQCAATIDEQISRAAWGGIGILPSATSNLSASLRGRYTGSVSTLSALNSKVAGFTIRLSKQCSGLLAATGRLSTVILHAASAYNAATKITLKDIAEAVASLATRNVSTFTSDGYYLGIAHPGLLVDLRSDTATGGWIDWQKYSRPKETMMKGEVGEAEKVRILKSTQAIDRALNRGCLVSATVLTIVGKGALGFVDYGKSYDSTGKSYIIMQDSGGTFDPLEQIKGTVGWKCTMAAAVLNTSCGIHLLGLRNTVIS
jgi:N4-gp56 family major capsid protein